MKAKRIIYGVTRLMPHNAETFPLSTPFNFEHLCALKFSQSRMSQVERDREAWDFIGRKPFFG